MMSDWILTALLATGDFVELPQPNAAACFAEVARIARLADKVCILPGSPLPIAGDCRRAAFADGVTL